MVTFVIDFLGSSWHPLGWGGVGQICLGSNDSRINPYMRAKFGYSQMILSKKWGVQTDRPHTHKGTLQLYIVDSTVLSIHINRFCQPHHFCQLL